MSAEVGRRVVGLGDLSINKFLDIQNLVFLAKAQTADDIYEKIKTNSCLTLSPHLDCPHC